MCGIMIIGEGGEREKEEEGERERDMEGKEREGGRERGGGREVNGTNSRTCKCMHAIMCNLC